jgi:hypothetical protein
VAPHLPDVSPAQADGADVAVSQGVGEAVGRAIDQAVRPEARLDEAIILHPSHNDEFGGAGERDTVLETVCLVFTAIKLDGYSVFVYTKTLPGK